MSFPIMPILKPVVGGGVPFDIGNTDIRASTLTLTRRRVMKVTATLTGQIDSITFNHNATTGNVLVAIYDDVAGVATNRLGISLSTVSSAVDEWQTVPLISSVPITTGVIYWIGIVTQGSLRGRYDSNPIHYVSGANDGFVLPDPWTGNTPASFGLSLYASGTGS